MSKMAKKNGVEAVPVQMKNPKAEMEERLQKVLDGHEPPPNEFVEYLAGEVRQMRAEMGMLVERINQAKTQLQNMEQSAMQLQGAHNKSVQDLTRWLERTPSPQPTEPEQAASAENPEQSAAPTPSEPPTN